MNHKIHLRDLLTQDRLLEIPSVYDAMSAALAQENGFDGAFFGGGVTSHFNFGIPDIGVVSLPERLDHVRRSMAEVEIPSIVDMDQCGGKRTSMLRMVRLAEQAGISGLMIDDLRETQSEGILPVDEAVEVYRAAAEARSDPRTLIIAMNYSYFVEDLDAGIERANRYAQAGADMVMINGIMLKGSDISDLERAGSRVSIPMLWTIHGNPTPELKESFLKNNVKIAVYYPHATVAAYHAVSTVFKQIKAHEVPDIGDRNQLQRPFLDTIRQDKWEAFEGTGEFKAVTGHLISAAEDDV